MTQVDDRDQPDFEETEDAIVEGDRAYRRGTARAALAHRNFRLVWLGGLGSNVGTWMQNVALGAYAYELTRSAGFVALLGFVQLGPMLALSLVGGALADLVDRRRLVVTSQAVQMVLAFVLASIVRVDDPARSAILGIVLMTGIANALTAPALSALLPNLVPRPDLPGAVSLQSVNMNLSRVIGPAIGGVILPTVGPEGVFAINGLTYLFVIYALLRAAPRGRTPRDDTERGWTRVVGGFRVAREVRLVRVCLLTIASISFFCLPFIGLLPVLAAENLGINPSSAAYGVLYACFGFGAASGAFAVGTIMVGRSRGTAVRAGLLAFAVLLTTLGLLRTAWPAYPVIAVLGFAYFATVTSLSTTLQETLTDPVRGRVMSLWIMGFGGTVPIGLLVFGSIAEATSVTTVVLSGAAVALVLAAAVRLEPRRAEGRAPALR